MFPDGKPIETLQLLSLTQGHQNLINSYLQLILQFNESMPIMNATQPKPNLNLTQTEPNLVGALPPHDTPCIG